MPSGALEMFCINCGLYGSHTVKSPNDPDDKPSVERVVMNPAGRTIKAYRRNRWCTHCAKQDKETFDMTFMTTIEVDEQDFNSLVDELEKLRRLTAQIAQLLGETTKDSSSQR